MCSEEKFLSSSVAQDERGVNPTRAIQAAVLYSTCWFWSSECSVGNNFNTWPGSSVARIIPLSGLCIKIWTLNLFLFFSLGVCMTLSDSCRSYYQLGRGSFYSCLCAVQLLCNWCATVQAAIVRLIKIGGFPSSPLCSTCRLLGDNWIIMDTQIPPLGLHLHLKDIVTYEIMWLIVWR